MVINWKWDIFRGVYHGGYLLDSVLFLHCDSSMIRCSCFKKIVELIFCPEVIIVKLFVKYEYIVRPSRG